jgi:sensor histidine kinase regulating citrate/malate metabolism
MAEFLTKSRVRNVFCAALILFCAALIYSWVGGPVLSTAWSIGLGAVIGAPAAWYFARHIRRLMDTADAGTDPAGE